MKFANRITYAILIALGYWLGIMPMWLRYLHADIISFILYRLVRYRLRIVRINLSRSFPDKGKDELRRIESDFYTHLGDLMIETFSMIAISREDILKRFIYTNNDVFVDASADRSIIAAMAHVGMWEFATNYSLIFKNNVLAVYHPLSSKGADLFYQKIRSKFGVIPTPMNMVGRRIASRYKENICLALIADQCPEGHGEWYDFLNQKSYFYGGMERFALKYSMSIAYMNIVRVKRGYYEATYTLIYDGVESVEGGEITRRYVKCLERNIIQQPHAWLWSHKRWKRVPEGGDIYKKQ